MSIPRFKDTGSENVTKIYFVGHSGTKESGLILAIRTKKGILSDRMASKNGTKVQVQDSTEVTADHLSRRVAGGSSPHDEGLLHCTGQE